MSVNDLTLKEVIKVCENNACSECPFESDWGKCTFNETIPYYWKNTLKDMESWEIEEFLNDNQ